MVDLDEENHTVIGYYPVLKDIHMTLAIVSGVYFALRGGWRIGLGRTIHHRLWKSLPHLIDTLLLASGIALAVMLGMSPHQVGWFGAKLIGVVVYILLGITAFRSRRQPLAWLFYGSALLVWLWIIGVALYKSPASWLVVVAR